MTGNIAAEFGQVRVGDTYTFQSWRERDDERSIICGGALYGPSGLVAIADQEMIRTKDWDSKYRRNLWRFEWHGTGKGFNVTESVEGHYGNEGIVERIVQALADAGFDTENLDPDKTAGADEFHIGGREGTLNVASVLNLAPGQQLLDVDVLGER